MRIEKKNRIHKTRNMDDFIAPIGNQNWESNDCIIEHQNTSKNKVKENHLLINYLRECESSMT